MILDNDPNRFLDILIERRKKLDQTSLDWNAWKKGTLIVLKSIFGEQSSQVKQLEDLDYEYSSWSLRDTSGSGDPVKASAFELLDVCIAITGKASDNVSPLKKQLADALRNWVSQNTLSEIEGMARSEAPPLMIEENISKVLSGLEQSTLTRLLATIMHLHFRSP